MIEKTLYAFGYAVAHLLFLGAYTPKAVVHRLRLAYQAVGVRIVETPQIDDTNRTIFLCPYRNLAANRYGQTWICHTKLDRVDDGYVTYLRRYRHINYQRPHRCTDLSYCQDSEYCYSDVSRL